MKKNVFRAVVGALLLMGAAHSGMAAERQMKMSLWVPPAHPIVADLEKWAQSLSQASEGTIKATIYPAQQLGKAADHYDMARDGIVEYAMVAPGYSPGRFPIWSLIELPFSFSNSTSGARALHEWYLKYAPVEMKDVHVCLVSMHHPGVFHFKDNPVRMPAELARRRIRPAGPGMAQFITQLGGTNVQASLPEVRQLAERGVVDGVTFAWDIFVIGADPILKHHMDEPMYVTSQVHAINKRFYDSLDDRQKKALDEHCTPEWSERINQGWAREELAARDRLKNSPEHDVYTLTDTERAAWREAARPLVDQAHEAVQKRYRLDAKEIHQELLKTLEKHNARYQSNG